MPYRPSKTFDIPEDLLSKTKKIFAKIWSYTSAYINNAPILIISDPEESKLWDSLTDQKNQLKELKAEVMNFASIVNQIHMNILLEFNSEFPKIGH